MDNNFARMVDATVPCHPTVKRVLVVQWRHLYLVTQLRRVYWSYCGGTFTLSHTCGECVGHMVEAPLPCHRPVESVLVVWLTPVPYHPTVESVLIVRW